MNKKLIYGLVVLIAGFWGLSFLATSILVKYVEPIQVQAFRWLIAGTIFIALIISGKIKIDLSKPTARYLFVLGFCQPCIYMIFETYGIMKTSASIGSIFVATIPCAILIGNAVFRHRRTSRIGVLSIVIAVTGVIICTVFSSDFSLEGSALGYILMTCAVIAGAAYSIVSNKLGEDYEAIEVTAVMAMMGLVFFNILNWIMGYGFKTYTVYFTNPKLTICIFFLGVCCSAICYLAFNKILAMIDPAMGNNLAASMTTVIGVIAGIFIGGDPGGIYTIVGLALTLTGVYISSTQIN